jgi:hypothetical protein
VSAPERGTEAYRWWAQGARDEAEIRDERLSAKQREVRDVLVGLAQRRPDEPVGDLVMRVARIYTAGVPLRRRLQHAWRLVRK